MKQTNVIYNPSSISSVLAAAHYIQHSQLANYTSVGGAGGTTYKTYVPGGKLPEDSEQAIWIGVTPTINTMLTIKGYHTAYLSHEIQDKKLLKHKGYTDLVVYTLGHTFFAPEWCECMEVIPATPFTAVLFMMYDQSKDSNGEMWHLPELHTAILAAQFEAGKELDLLTQAIIWDNYTHALRYLSGTETSYELKLVTTKPDESKYQAELKNYKDGIRTVKQLLNMVFETVGITIGQQHFTVPFLNVDQILSPLMMRIISKSYDQAITYVQRKGVNVYTVFSRIAGFDKVVLEAALGKCIPAMLDNSM